MDGVNREIYDDYIEYQFYTPAGEDFNFAIPITDNEQHELYKYAEEFNADEHAELWIDKRGQHGVPPSVRELVEDAEWIKDKLLVLAEEVSA